MDFKTILYRISLSDEEAFRKLFEHFFPGLLSFASSILKKRCLAEEVVEDVFIKLWEKRDSITVVRNISFYLYKSVRYTSINALIKQKKYNSLSLDELGESFVFSCAGSEPDLISQENCQKITDAINRLPAKCRLIFWLVKDKRLKYKEVSQVLNISDKTVKNQMNIAFGKLIKDFSTTLPELWQHFLSSNKVSKKLEQTNIDF